MTGDRRVAIVTQFDGTDTHTDGPLLVAAFTAAGLSADVVPWGWPGDWSTYDLVAVRHTWDYLDRLPEFLGWARAVEAVTVLANPSTVLEWNSDKRYLRDVADAGVPTVPTVWVEPGDDLARTLADVPWEEVVVKPSVSAGSRATARYRLPHELERAGAHGRALAAQGLTVMLQPYLTDVDRNGELGTYVFGGRVSHAIRKGPVLLPEAEPPDDFSLAIAQQAEAVPVSDELAAFADGALVGVRERFGDVLYARVDAVRAPDGVLALLELELFEPFLFLETSPGAADRFVAAVIEVLEGG